MSTRVVSIHQPECFPWLGFIDKAASCDIFVLLDDAQYVKNYFNNRNKIRTAQGWSWLTIPVVTSGRSTQAIAEVKLQDASSPWRRKHLATWMQNYGPSKFGDHYIPFLRELYARPFDKLCDLNVATIRWLLDQFEVGAEVMLSSELACPGASTEKLLSICRKLGAGVYLSGISGREYLDESKFQEAGITVRYQEFHHPIYRQRFEPFIPALSAFDLLFNYGPEAPRILRDSTLPRLEEVFT